MVWRRSCVLPLSCLKCRAARLCTHRREGCPLRHCEFPPILALVYALLTAAVQNYDFPNNCEDYIHRIGRTGVSLGPDIDADGRVTDIVLLSVLA